MQTTMQRQRVSFEKDVFTSSELSKDQNGNVGSNGKTDNARNMDTNNIPESPSPKERLAYAIEFSAKILYPIFFLIYNIVYWTSYYGM